MLKCLNISTHNLGSALVSPKNHPEEGTEPQEAYSPVKGIATGILSLRSQNAMWVIVLISLKGILGHDGPQWLTTLETRKKVSTMRCVVHLAGGRLLRTPHRLLSKGFWFNKQFL